MKRAIPCLFALLLISCIAEQQNEYLAEWSALPERWRTGGCVGAWQGGIGDPAELAKVKRYFTGKYSWAIPTADAIQAIAKNSSGRIVDLGAGTGYCAYLLSQRGVSVAGIDNGDDWQSQKLNLWHEVVLGNETSLRQYPGYDLMMVWPPRNGMASRALELWRGDTLFYVGEMLRGNADIAFFDRLDKEFVLVEKVEIPNWYNRSDALYILKSSQPLTSGWVKRELSDRCPISNIS